MQMVFIFANLQKFCKINKDLQRSVPIQKENGPDLHFFKKLTQCCQIWPKCDICAADLPDDHGAVAHLHRVLGTEVLLLEELRVHVERDVLAYPVLRRDLP